MSFDAYMRCRSRQPSGGGLFDRQHRRWWSIKGRAAGSSPDDGGL